MHHVLVHASTYAVSRRDCFLPSIRVHSTLRCLAKRHKNLCISFIFSFKMRVHTCTAAPVQWPHLGTPGHSGEAGERRQVGGNSSCPLSNFNTAALAQLLTAKAVAESETSELLQVLAVASNQLCDNYF